MVTNEPTTQKGVAALISSSREACEAILSSSAATRLKLPSNPFAKQKLTPPTPLDPVRHSGGYHAAASSLVASYMSALVRACSAEESTLHSASRSVAMPLAHQLTCETVASAFLPYLVPALLDVVLVAPAVEADAVAADLAAAAVATVVQCAVPLWSILCASSADVAGAIMEGASVIRGSA